MPSIATDYQNCDSETSDLLALARDLGALKPSHQKLVAEIITIRLLDIFQNFVATVARKLVAGAVYLDGSRPILLISARSVRSAQTLFMSHGRGSSSTTRWTRASYIADAVRHVINASDHYLTVIRSNGAVINEVRKIRNRIAHNNANSRQEYQGVVKTYYGANLNNITPGILLLTDRLTPPLLEQQIIKMRIVMKDLVKV